MAQPKRALPIANDGCDMAAFNGHSVMQRRPSCPCRNRSTDGQLSDQRPAGQGVQPQQPGARAAALPAIGNTSEAFSPVERVALRDMTQSGTKNSAKLPTRKGNFVTR
jgi:hypothetical protein